MHALSPFRRGRPKVGQPRPTCELLLGHDLAERILADELSVHLGIADDETMMAAIDDPNFRWGAERAGFGHVHEPRRQRRD